MNRLCIVLITLIAFASFGCSSTPKRKPRAKATPVEKPKGPSAQELFVQGNKQLERGDWDDAAATYADAIDEDPKRWDIYVNRAIALSRDGELDGALNAIERAMQNGGDDKLAVYYNLGNIYQDFGLYPQAIDAYRAGLAHTPQLDIDSLVNIGSCFVSMRNYEAAQKTYDRLREIAPDDPRAVHGKAITLRLQEKYDEAEALYDEVHAMAPDFALPYLTEADMLGQMRRYDEAIATLQRYLQISDDEKGKQRARSMMKRFQNRAERYQ